MRVDTDNPDLWKHTLYAVAWDILSLPPGYTPAAARQRVFLKRRCVAYANLKGYSLRPIALQADIETWELQPKQVPAFVRTDVFTGTLQQCCLEIVRAEVPAEVSSG